MYRYVSRRISAFLVDICLVTFISSILASTTYMNPFIDDYRDAYSNYQEIYKENSLSFIENPSIKSMNEYSKFLSKYIYKLDYYLLFNNLYYLLFYFLYFVIFAYFTKGQTIGKKLFKLRVLRKDGENVTIKNLLLRGLFGGSTIIMGINLIVIVELLLLFIKNADVYFYITLILSFISYIIDIIALCLLATKSKRSIDDYVGGTRVIDEVKYV